MEEILCLFCGKKIKQTLYSVFPGSKPRYTNKVYCDEKCRRAMERVKYKKYYIKWNKEHTWIFNNKDKRVCIVCKEEFLPKSKNQFYCSERCRKKNWKIQHREEVLEKERQYNAIRKLDPIKKEIDRESNKRSRQKHREKHYEWKRNYRARKVGNGGKHTKKEWEELKAKYNFTCVGCGRKEPEIKLTEDHIVPLTLEGDNSIGNIQPLCKSCNSKKSNHLNYEFNN